MNKTLKGHEVKKGTVLNVVIATVLTVGMLVLLLPTAVVALVRIVAYGEFDNLFFLLPVPIAAVIIYTIWRLIGRYSQLFREYVIFFGLLFGSLILYVANLAPCSGVQLCLNLEPFVAFGVFLLIVFLLTLWYLVRVRMIERKSTTRKRITK